MQIIEIQKERRKNKLQTDVAKFSRESLKLKLIEMRESLNLSLSLSFGCFASLTLGAVLFSFCSYALWPS